MIRYLATSKTFTTSETFLNNKEHILRCRLNIQILFTISTRQLIQSEEILETNNIKNFLLENLIYTKTFVTTSHNNV